MKTDEGAALIRYRDGKFRVFTEADGLPGGWIRDLFVDHAGRLWIANTKSGVLRLDDVNADKLQFVRYADRRRTFERGRVLPDRRRFRQNLYRHGTRIGQIKSRNRTDRKFHDSRRFAEQQYRNRLPRPSK